MTLLSNCAPIVIAPQSPGPDPYPERREEVSLEYFGIPKGQLPPVGSCRIWYPHRPAGQQPPPFDCSLGMVDIPLGVYLILRLDDKTVRIDEYDTKRSNYIVRTGTYAIE